MMQLLLVKKLKAYKLLLIITLMLLLLITLKDFSDKKKHDYFLLQVSVQLFLVTSETSPSGMSRFPGESICPCIGSMGHEIDSKRKSYNIIPTGKTANRIEIPDPVSRYWVHRL